MVEHKITQSELGKILNVDASTISRSLNDKFLMKTESLCLLSYYFDIPLEQVLNYDAVVKPHQRIKAQLMKDRGVYEFSKEEELDSILSFSEELENQNISYSKLLRDVSYEQAEITLDSGDKFKAGDLVFYRKESLLRNGFVLYYVYPKQLEVRLLMKSGREIKLHHPNNFEDAILVSGSPSKAGRVLGYLYYLIRRFDKHN